MIIDQGKSNQKKTLILAGFLAAMMLHLVFTFAGFYGGDDINYARYAAEIAQNGLSFQPADNHFQLRWSTIYVTSVFYKLFGINAFTSTLFSFLSFAGCGLLLHKILRTKNNTEYALAMALFFFAHSIVFYMHRLLPDTGMCLAIFGMYYCYRSADLKALHQSKYGICFAAGLLFAVITKETIIIAIPLFILLLVRDLMKRRNLKFWKTASIASVIVVLTYLMYFKITTGDFLYRYQLLQAKSYLNICSFESLPFSYTLKRIGYELWLAMLLKGDLILFLPAIAAVIYKDKIADVRSKDIYAFLVLLLCTNFMSISFTSYVPLCHDPRHFIFLFPFAAIIGSPLLLAYAKAPSKFIGLPLLFVGATAIMFTLNAGNSKYFYLLFTGLIVAKYLLSPAGFKSSVAIFIYMYIVLLSTNYLIAYVKPIYPFYWDHKKVAEQAFKGNVKPASVFSADPISAELNEFFLGFKTGKIRFLTIDSIKTENEEPLYYLINKDIYNPGKVLDSLINKPDIIRIAQEKNVILYRVNNAFLQSLKGAEK